MKSKWSKFSDLELETIGGSLDDGCSFMDVKLANCQEKILKQISKERERRKLTGVASK